MGEYLPRGLEENIQVPISLIQIASILHMADSQQGSRFRKVSLAHPLKMEPTSSEPPCTITALFENQARLHPFNAAVQFENETAFTFASLKYTSERIAAALTVRQGSVVPIFMDQSVNMVASILGVLKSGAAYLILDPASPMERNRFIIAEVTAKTVIMSRKYADLLPSATIVEDLLQEFDSSNTDKSSGYVQKRIDPASPAYVIYTSGSTGRPKGVFISHAAASHGISHFSLGGKSRWLLFFNPIFSAAQRTILATICKGACLCLSSRTRLATSLNEVIKNMNIDALGLTPSILATLSPEQMSPCLKQITAVGEPVGKGLLDVWTEKVEFRVSYGLSECAQLNFSRRIHKGDNPRIVGRPTDTTKAFVLLPDSTELAGIGKAGELCLTGPQLADGYLQRPAETAKSFIVNPFGPGRMYRTGDLVMQHSEDSFEILGRIDYQIKLYGQRLEPGEIVTVLQQHLGVTAAALIAASVSGNKALVAAVVPDPNCEWGQLVGGLRDMARRMLPPYMVPSYWLDFEKLPLNANGKVDINKIRERVEETPAEEMLGRREKSDSPPEIMTDPVEQLIRKLWAKILNLESFQIGRDDSFFMLGGNSMQAITMINELRKEGIDLGNDAIFSHQSLASLRAEAVIKAIPENLEEKLIPFSMIGDDSVAASLKTMKGVVDAYRATPLQEGLVGLTLQGSTDYLYQRTFDVRHLDLIRLKLAFQLQYSRTDILRTTFLTTEAGLMQAVRNNMPLPWKEVESTSLLEFKQEDLQAGVDLGGPFVRLTVLNKATLVVTMHHALFDFWSSGFLYEDVSQLYQGLDPVTRPPFKKFVRTLLHMDTGESKAFWAEYLSEASRTSLEFAPVPNKTNVHRAVSYDLHKLATSNQVTASTIVYTAWALVLSQHTASRDITFATPLSGREVSVEDGLRLDGPTLTIVPRRFNFKKDANAREALQSAHKRSWEILKHSQYGLRLALKAAHHSTDLFDTMVNLLPHKPVDTGVETAISDVFRIHGEKPTWQTEYTTLEVQQVGDHWEFRLTTHIEPLRARLIIDQFVEALFRITNEPEEPLASLSLLTNQEIQMLEPGQDLPETLPQLLHAGFEQMIKAYPFRMAIQWEANGALTYSMLDRLSNQLARYLQSQGLRQGDFACLLVDKSPLMIASMLAILKLGAAYVPLSPENPVERNSFIVGEVAAKLVLSESSVTQAVALNGPPVVFLDHVSLRGYSRTAINNSVSGNDSAYIIYTSGSTGKPKGVLIPHSAAAAAVDSMIHTEKRREGCWRTLQFSNYIFDASVLEIFNTLNSGGTLCLAPTDRLHSELTQVISEMDVNHAFFTPTVARLLSPDDVPTLRTLTVGGEAVTDDITSIWNKGHRIIQAYGPTETAMVATMRDMSHGDDPRNIGKPLRTAKAFIVEKDASKLVPYGAIGELCIAGPQLGVGYLKRPEITAAAFCKATIPGFDTMYRSGDLARWLPSGEIEYLGRKDNQVKINGHRIELGEIEKVVLATGMVVDCKTVVANIGTKAQLAAFVVFETSDIEGIQLPDKYVAQVALLKNKLGDLAHYMYPKVVLPLGSMPRMPSGKTDRKLLKLWVESLDTEKVSTYVFDSFGVSSAGEMVPVETKQQQFLEQAWIKVLDLPRKPLGLEADFLTFGGDSITAINLTSYLRKHGYQLSVSDVLSHPKLADMENHMTISPEHQKVAVRAPFQVPEKVIQDMANAGLTSEDVDYTYPCPPGQIEFLQQGARKENMWVLMTSRPLPVDTNVAHWIKTAERLTETNDILRTTFARVGKTWIGVVLKSSVITLDFIEISDDIEKAKALNKIWKSDFVFGKPFVRYAILSRPDGSKDLVTKMDHGLYDGTLLRIFAAHFRELQHGRPAPEHTPFRDFAFHHWNSDKEAALKFWSNNMRPTAVQYPQIADPLADKSVVAAADLDLDGFANACGVTVPIVFQASFQLWLASKTGQFDIGMDYLYTGRNIDMPNPQQINGICCNFLPLRAQAKEGQSVKEYLVQTQSDFWSATENSVVGLDEIYAAVGLDRWTVGNRSVFLFQPFEPPAAANAAEELRWVVMAGSEVTMAQPYGLVCEARKTVGGYKIKFTFDTRVFTDGEAMMGAKEVMEIAKQMLEKKDASVRALLGGCD